MHIIILLFVFQYKTIYCCRCSHDFHDLSFCSACPLHMIVKFPSLQVRHMQVHYWNVFKILASHCFMAILTTGLCINGHIRDIQFLTTLTTYRTGCSLWLCVCHWENIKKQPVHLAVSQQFAIYDLEPSEVHRILLVPNGSRETDPAPCNHCLPLFHTWR